MPKKESVNLKFCIIMLLKIKVWNKSHNRPEVISLNPNTFYKCVEKADELNVTYILTTTQGERFELLDTEVKKLEEAGYIVQL